jgi:hypothetical protein
MRFCSGKKKCFYPVEFSRLLTRLEKKFISSEIVGGKKKKEK